VVLRDLRGESEKFAKKQQTTGSETPRRFHIASGKKRPVSGNSCEFPENVCVTAQSAATKRTTLFSRSGRCSVSAFNRCGGVWCGRRSCGFVCFFATERETGDTDDHQCECDQLFHLQISFNNFAQMKCACRIIRQNCQQVATQYHDLQYNMTCTGIMQPFL